MNHVACIPSSIDKDHCMYCGKELPKTKKFDMRDSEVKQPRWISDSPVPVYRVRWRD